MKKLLVILPLVFSSFAFAGTPSEDPVIAGLRERFAKGDVPSKWNLKLKKEWNCNHRSASAGYFAAEDLTMRFVESGGLFINQPVRHFSVSPEGGDPTFVVTSVGLVSVAPTEYPNIVVKTVLRESKGDLIGESVLYGLTAEASAELARNALTVAAVSYPNGRASAYTVCTKSSVRKVYDGPVYVPSVAAPY